jgi:hypothetical protein
VVGGFPCACRFRGNYLLDLVHEQATPPASGIG